MRKIKIGVELHKQLTFSITRMQEKKIFKTALPTVEIQKKKKKKKRL